MPLDIDGNERINKDMPNHEAWRPIPWPGQPFTDFPFVPYEPGQSHEMCWSQNFAFLFASGENPMSARQARLLAVAFLELYQLVYPRSAAKGPPYPPILHHPSSGLAPAIAIKEPLPCPSSSSPSLT